MVRIAAMPMMSIIANADDLAMLQGVRHGQEASGMLSSSRLHSEEDTMPDVVGTASMLQSLADRISTSGKEALDPETEQTLIDLARNLELTQSRMDNAHGRDDAHLGEIISNFTTGDSACPNPRDHSHVSGFGAHHGNTSRDLESCFRQRNQIHNEMDTACAVAHSELTNEIFLNLGAASTQSDAFTTDVEAMEAPQECEMPAPLALDAHGHDSVEQHLDHMLAAIQARKSAWETCVSKAEEFKQLSASCEEAAQTFEQGFCTERLNFLIACHDYETCYVEKSGTFESEWELVGRNMHDRKTMNVHIETLKCMMTALRGASTAAVHHEFEICKDNSQNTTWKEEQRQRFHLDQAALPLNLECTQSDLAVTLVHPGTEGWAWKIEGTAFTGNEIISRCRSAHECDPVPAQLAAAEGLTGFLNDQVPQPEPEPVIEEVEPVVVNR